MENWLDKDLSYGSSVGSDCRLGGGKDFFTCDYGVAFVTTENYNSVINTLTLDGRHDVLPMKDGSVDCFDKSADGTLYFVGMRENRLQEIYGIKNGVEEKITSFNDEILDGKYVAVPEQFTYENGGTQTLKDEGFTENDLDKLTELAFTTPSLDGLLGVAPIEATRENVREIYAESL